MSISWKELVDVLEALAPLRYAESWDKVGVQVEGKKRRIRQAYLTIDLTREVVEEVVAAGADAIVSYHPFIFEPLAALRRDDAKEGSVLTLVEKGISVYSPHTALDAAPAGINDWLAEAFPKAKTEPLLAAFEHRQGQEMKLVVFTPKTAVSVLREALGDLGLGVIGLYDLCSFGVEGTGSFRGAPECRPAVGESGRLEEVEEVRLEMVMPRRLMKEAVHVIRRLHPYEEPAFDVYELAPPPMNDVGVGRLVRLARPVTLSTVVRRVKEHLGLTHLRVAESREGAKKISTVALCAGAGGSVLAGAAADLWLTGEMRHHDVLAATQSGIHVILSEHTHTERGYLPRLRSRLEAACEERVRWVISQRDVSPLRIR